MNFRPVSYKLRENKSYHAGKECTHCQKKEKQLIKAGPQITYLMGLANEYGKDCQGEGGYKEERNGEFKSNIEILFQKKRTKWKSHSKNTMSEMKIYHIELMGDSSLRIKNQ